MNEDIIFVCVRGLEGERKKGYGDEEERKKGRWKGKKAIVEWEVFGLFSLHLSSIPLLLLLLLYAIEIEF